MYGNLPKTTQNKNETQPPNPKKNFLTTEISDHKIVRKRKGSGRKRIWSKPKAPKKALNLKKRETKGPSIRRRPREGKERGRSGGPPKREGDARRPRRTPIAYIAKKGIGWKGKDLQAVWKHWRKEPAFRSAGAKYFGRITERAGRHEIKLNCCRGHSKSRGTGGGGGMTKNRFKGGGGRVRMLAGATFEEGEKMSETFCGPEGKKGKQIVKAKHFVPRRFQEEKRRHQERTKSGVWLLGRKGGDKKEKPYQKTPQLKKKNRREERECKTHPQKRLKRRKKRVNCVES